MEKTNRRKALKKISLTAAFLAVAGSGISASAKPGNVDIYFILVPASWSKDRIAKSKDALTEKFKEVNFIFISDNQVARPEVLRVRDFASDQVESLAAELAKYILKTKTIF